MLQFIFIFLILIGSASAHTAMCELSVHAAENAITQTFQRRIVKPAEKLDPVLAQHLARIFLSTESPAQGFKEVIIELKRRELAFFSDPHRIHLGETLSREQIHYLVSGGNFQKYNLPSRSNEELTNFYANHLKQLLLITDRVFREHLVRQSLSTAREKDISADEVRMLVSLLRILNHGTSKPEDFLRHEQAQEAYQRYQPLTSAQSDALVQAYRIYQQDARSPQVIEIIDGAGFNWSQRNSIIGAWRQPKWNEWNCCRMGCSDCAINYGLSR